MLLADIFALRPQAFRHAAESPRSPLWMAVFLLGTGVGYGALVAGFQRHLGVTFHGIAAAEVPNWILLGGNALSGALVTLMFHGGVTLLVWLAAKGVGGPGNLGLLYRATSYLLPLTLPALPLLALDSAAQGELPAVPVPGAAAFPPLAWLAAILLLGGLYQLLRTTQGASPTKAALAVVGFAFFCSPFLLF